MSRPKSMCQNSCNLTYLKLIVPMKYTIIILLSVTSLGRAQYGGGPSFDESIGFWPKEVSWEGRGSTVKLGLGWGKGGGWAGVMVVVGRY